jgi:sugar (pentulose or hexulose) kinase
MTATPVIAIFDVGKTNKKLFLFDEDYNIIFERSARYHEIVDEDGFPCENLESLRQSVFDALNEISHTKEFELKAVNFSAYGASWVLVDQKGNPVAPIYNYLKPYPGKLSDELYKTYHGKAQFALETASPVLGSLNSGLQLYRIKKEKTELFRKLKYALHLPQYLSSLLTGKFYSDITSIGCHTALWDFNKNEYHEWVEQEGILSKLAAIKRPDSALKSSIPGSKYIVGTGLHDSSAALIPYLMSFTEPFVLISTGTWAISMNPFNYSPLTATELENDCLCYLSYTGKPVKAARLFAGHDHDEQVKRIADHFNVPAAQFKNLPFDPKLAAKLTKNPNTPFEQTNLSTFEDHKEAYHQLMLDLMRKQVISTNFALEGTGVKRIFVDGGFSRNAVYMNLLANAYPGTEIFSASMAQASALGAALAIHDLWNTKPLPRDIIELKYYAQAML